MSAIILAVLPEILLIFLGVIVAKSGFFRDDNNIIQDFLNKLAVPALILIAINNNSIAHLINPSFVFGYLLISFFMLGGTFLFFRVFLKRARLISYFAGLNNSLPAGGLISLPILLEVFGEKAVLPIAITAIIVMCVLLPISIMVLEGLTSQGADKRAIMKNSLLSAIKNPLTIASLLGVSLDVMGIKIQGEVLDGFHKLAQTAVPCAMIIIGMSLADISIRGKLSSILGITLCSLLLRPLLAVSYASILGMDIIMGTALIVIFATPSTKLNFLLATRYGSFKEESAAIVSLSTLLCIITIPAYLYLASNIL